MRKVLVPLLAFGLFLMGVTPALAASQAANKVVHVTIPKGQLLDNNNLDQVAGKQAAGKIIDIFVGYVVGKVLDYILPKIVETAKGQASHYTPGDYYPMPTYSP